ncbi:hypothetical protein [Caulobacter hibisci]|uniref:RiboL-PSP-HEPN domain-containing protein n=1 Tax=Caulobacter hibisci TaxID=2035993 RepID=A0ABS0ST12_9CAUL|nr:hypothetical protein [Caulobacter hibisci]MBI1682691.1 hypothetical protein [Caulobacter hibisci]
MISNDWTRQALNALASAAADEVAFTFPARQSAAAGAFVHHHTGAFGVLLTATSSAVFADNAAHVAAAITNGDSQLPKGFDPHVPLPNAIGPHLRKLQAIQSQLFEMVYIRVADNLMTYVVDVMAECMRAQPNLIRSTKDSVPTDVLLNYDSMDELRAHLIERKLLGVAYLGLEGQCDWLHTHLGVSDLRKIPAFPSVVELIETRNCMVHSRAKVGEKFLRALRPFGVVATKGQPLEVSMDDLFVVGRAAVEFARHIDEQVIAKFDLAPSR